MHINICNVLKQNCRFNFITFWCCTECIKVWYTLQKKLCLIYMFFNPFLKDFILDLTFFHGKICLSDLNWYQLNAYINDIRNLFSDLKYKSFASTLHMNNFKIIITSFSLCFKCDITVKLGSLLHVFFCIECGQWYLL